MDDMPRRRRVQGRESSLRFGDDGDAGGGGGGGGGGRAPVYPSEPAGGGYFGPDPGALMSQKERLAAERKARGASIAAKCALWSAHAARACAAAR